MKSQITSKFERSIIFGFGRYVANFSAITGLVLTLVGAATVLYAYPEKRLADHPVDWLSKNKPEAKLPKDYSAYYYETRYPEKLSLKECFQKNSAGVAALSDPAEIGKWNASLFGEAMIAFADKKVNLQSDNKYAEYTLDQNSNVPEGIAELARKVCADALAKSTSGDSKIVFWQTREPVLLAAASYGKYFEKFNNGEDERKARLIPGAITLITGILIAFLGSMSSSLFAIERNTRPQDFSSEEKV